MFRCCSLKTSHPHLLPESKSLFCTSVSLFLFCILGYHYHLSKFHIYVLVYCKDQRELSSGPHGPPSGGAHAEGDCTWPHIVTVPSTDPGTPDPLASALTTELVGAWFLGLLRRNCVNPVSPTSLWHIVTPTNSRYQTRSESIFFVCTILSSEGFISYRIWSLPQVLFFSILEIWVFIKMV